MLCTRFCLSFCGLALPVLALRPNVVFILTDDQDTHMKSLEYMPFVRRHLLDQGTHYQRHFCTVALCCPSRVSLLTGKAAHNTNVTDIFPPYGGYDKFISQGLNDNYLPLWLQEGGYNTYYTGKLMNYHNVLNYDEPFANGWTSSDFLLDPFTYQYLNGVWQRDSEKPKSEAGKYSTDLLKDKFLAYLEEGAKSGSPFFAVAAPIAPHANVILESFNGETPTSGDERPTATESMPVIRTIQTAPIPAERHKHLFQNLTVPRTPNFNPELPSGASWIAQLPRQNQSNVDINDEWYRNRLRALQAVDEMVDAIFQSLHNLGILENTFVVFTTDNGYHIGQHRLQPGKQCPFEEDLNIPLIIRGPGVPRNLTTDIVTTHTDLAPTFLEMLGIDLRPDFDGAAIPFTRHGIHAASRERFEHVNVEQWGQTDGQKAFMDSDVAYNTYKALRLFSKTFNLQYNVFCDNAHELHDMNVDPYQMLNLFPKGNYNLPIASNTTISGHSISKIIPRLDALLMVLKTCKTDACTKPWEVIHPAGNVRNLVHALDSRYDSFYSHSYATNRVSFTKCEFGQLLESEGSLVPSIFDMGYDTAAMT